MGQAWQTTHSTSAKKSFAPSGNFSAQSCSQPGPPQFWVQSL